VQWPQGEAQSEESNIRSRAEGGEATRVKGEGRWSLAVKEDGALDVGNGPSLAPTLATGKRSLTY